MNARLLVQIPPRPVFYFVFGKDTELSLPHTNLSEYWLVVGGAVWLAATPSSLCPLLLLKMIFQILKWLCTVFPFLLCSGEEVRLDREKILRALLMTELWGLNLCDPTRVQRSLLCTQHLYNIYNELCTNYKYIYLHCSNCYICVFITEVGTKLN